MHSFALLDSVAVALSLAFAGGLVARLLRISPIVGYLVAGVVISPFTPGYDADVETLRQLAELGVVFLMFGVGLHFSLRQLNAVKVIAVPGAIGQTSLATATTLLAAVLFGLDWREGLVLGLAVSVASTVVLIRGLETLGLLESRAGQVAIGWLIVEDLVTVLVLVLIPSLAPGAAGDFWREAAVALLKAVVFLGLGLGAGARLVPPLLAAVSRTGSRELFTLAIVAVALAIATVAARFGLSVAIGAFVAGLAVGQSESSHQAAAEVLPFRDAFAVLFFVSVGMLLDPAAVVDHPGLLMVTIAVVLVAKPLFALAVTVPMRAGAATSLTVAAGLAQVGEFSFIVAEEGFKAGVVTTGTYNVILASSVVSIALNPLAYWLIGRWSRLREPALVGVGLDSGGG